jgi:hypothetical protein
MPWRAWRHNLLAWGLLVLVVVSLGWLRAHIMVGAAP